MAKKQTITINFVEIIWKHAMKWRWYHSIVKHKTVTIWKAKHLVSVNFSQSLAENMRKVDHKK